VLCAIHHTIGNSSVGTSGCIIWEIAGSRNDNTAREGASIIRGGTGLSVVDGVGRGATVGSSAGVAGASKDGLLGVLLDGCRSPRKSIYYYKRY
jgi:hypothetical protein